MSKVSKVTINAKGNSTVIFYQGGQPVKQSPNRSPIKPELSGLLKFLASLLITLIPFCLEHFDKLGQ